MVDNEQHHPQAPAAVQPQPVFQVDPFVVQTLQTAVGRQVVIETARGSVLGVLKDVRPDHVTLLDTYGFVLIVRIAQIIWIKPL